MQAATREATCQSTDKAIKTHFKMQINRSRLIYVKKNLVSNKPELQAKQFAINIKPLSDYLEAGMEQNRKTSIYKSCQFKAPPPRDG